jgi:hypothetical protein
MNIRTLISVVSVLCMVAGCHKAAPQKPAEPVVKVLTIPEFARPAVDTLGGEKAWSQTQAITGECVVKLYKQDSIYITSELHAVYPWSDSIRIVDNEPQGRFEWRLFRDDWMLLSGSHADAQQLPQPLQSKYTAEALWSLMAPPARIAELAQPSSAAPVMINGVWYMPIKLEGNRTYFQNRSTGIVDMILIPTTGGSYILARGYDYRAILDTMVVIPQKVEIFESNASAVPGGRIMEFTYTKLATHSF